MRAVGTLARLARESGFGVLLTSTTAGGVAAARAVGASTSALWFDNPRTTSALLSASPAAVLVAEAEVWPNLLLSTACPVFAVGARMSPRSCRAYRLLGVPMRRVFSRYARVFARSAEDARRFASCGARRVEVGGNLKYDALPTGARREPERFTVVLGSVRSRELGDLKRAAGALAAAGARVVVVPRHPHRRWEALSRHATVVNRVGTLLDAYRSASVAFVGGTLAPYGGHNLLEPAAMGLPVLFGPHCESVASEAAGLLLAGGGFAVRDGDALAHAALALRDDTARAAAGRAADRFVQRRRGAGARVWRAIERAI